MIINKINDTIMSEANVAEENNSELIIILEIVNEICKKNAVDFFAVGALLKEALFCHEILDEEKIRSYKIGMTRSDYDRIKSQIINMIILKKDSIIAREGITKEGKKQDTIQIGKNKTFYELKNGQNVKAVNFSILEIIPFDYNFRNGTFYSAENFKLNITKKDLFPIKYEYVNRVKLGIPNNYRAWIHNFDASLPVYSELDALQHVNKMQSSILKKIDFLFSSEGLNYFAFSSLLVGAEYYNDFPVSSQIENFKLGMVSEDFKKIRKFDFSGVFNGDIVIQDSLKTEKLESSILIGKYVQYYYYREGKYHFSAKFCGIEICPFEYVPDSYEQQRFYFWLIRKLRFLYNSKMTTHDNSLCTRSILCLYKNILRGALISLSKKYFKKTKTFACIIPRKSKIICYNQIFPLKRCKFRDFEISVPNDISVWCILPNQEIEKRTKSIQKVSLEILKKIDYACSQLGIGYFICGGSMLGAVRDGGFIPWDDDIDVGMLRKDYDIFLKYGQKVLGDDLFLQTRETDPKIPYLFSKVRKNNTLYVTNYNEFRHFHKGICVDVFPFDNIPNDPYEQDAFRKEVRKWEKLHNRVVNKQKPQDYFMSDFHGLEQGIVHLVNLIHRKVYCLIPLWLTQEIYLRHAEKYDTLEGLNYVASFVPSYTYIKKDDLLPYKRINFSGFMALAPKHPEVFLEMQYGDFMKLPPLHHRMGHDLIKWSVNTRLHERGDFK